MLSVEKDVPRNELIDLSDLGRLSGDGERRHVRSLDKLDSVDNIGSKRSFKVDIP